MVSLRKPLKSTASEQLLKGPIGDVVAARGIAEALLDPSVVASLRRDARLLLTATFLRLDSGNGPDVTWTDVLALLVGAASDAPEVLSVFESSPTQFLQFAGAELSSLDEHELSLTIKTCIETVKLNIRKSP